MNTTHSDIEVLKSSQSTPWMFGLLVDRYQEAFLRKASYILRSESLAEDAVQETFLKIYKAGPKFAEQEGASFSSWAYKILTNTCSTLLYRHIAHRERVAGADLDVLDSFGSESTTSAEESGSLVRSVFARLPARMGRLLSLYFLEELSYEEIARSEDLSLSAVKSGLHRAKKQFKEVAINLS